MMCQKHENTLTDDEISKNNNENSSDTNDAASSDNSECSNDELAENNIDNPKSRNIGLYVTLISVLVAVIAINVIAVKYGLLNGLSDRKLQKLLRENGYNYDSAKVETVLDLNNDVKGLDNNGSNKLVLINNNGYYGLAVINTQTNKVTIPTFGYIPLNVVQQEIWNMGKDVNIKNASILKKYIEKYGVNGLENKEYAEEYLREITGIDGIIQTETAQNIISNSTMSIFKNIKSPDEVTVLFEKNSAVPLYYATQSSQMVYNWSQIFSEYVYNIWSVNTDRKTQQTMMAIYGPPYVSKTVWAVVNSDLKEVGTFNSLESAKAVLLSENKAKTNKLSDKKDASNKSAKNEQKTNDSKRDLILQTNPEYEPFEYYNENNKISGIDIEIAQYIAKKLDLELVIQPVDFDSLLQNLSQGKCDIVLSGMMCTEDRKKYAYFSDPYYDDYCIALNKDNTELNKRILRVYNKMKQNGSLEKILNKYSAQIEDIGLNFTDYKNNILLTGKDISTVRTEYDNDKKQYYIALTFTAQGRKKFKKATADIAKLPSPNNKIDIKLDGIVISSPSVSEEIDSDSCIISGDFSKESAESLAKQIEDAM